jgi:hypothetical protein
LSSYNKYDIKTLADNFRVITVQKARDGASSVEVGVNFFGRNGLWHDLPSPDKINDYSRYTSPNYILSPEEDVEENIEEDKEEKTNFKFVM